jgi:chromatin remodeling complex protein RSC6
MATTNEKVMEMVRAELEKDPEVSVADLYQKARKISRSISSLTLRQFHARYPLQIKRKKSAGKKAVKKKRAAKKATKKVAAKKRATRKKTTAKRRKTRTRARKKVSAAGSAAHETSSSPAADRDAVRAVLLKFAADLAAAEERKDAVKVIAGVDGYVDDVFSSITKA